MKRITAYAIAVIALVALFFFGLRAYGEAVAYERTAAELARQTTPEVLAEFRAKEWMERFSLGLYKNETKERLRLLKKEIRKHRERSMRWMRYAMFALGALFMSYLLLSLRAFTFFGAVAAGIALLFGLNAPVLTVTIHKQIAYLGDAVLSFESKGVLGSIEKLYDNGEFVVAGVILLFSVIVPAVKVVAVALVSVFMTNPVAHRAVLFFKHLGKWSMVDVFVVAIFLVYLSTDNGDVSRAEVGIGLYFFLAYVTVSMLIGLSAEKLLRSVR